MRLTPDANRFLNDLQRDRARQVYVEGATLEQAAAEGTKLAKSFAAAMRSGMIESLDGAPCVEEGRKGYEQGRLL